MPHTLALAALPLHPGLTSPCPQPGRASQDLAPDVLLFVLDDVGYDDLLAPPRDDFTG